MRFSFLDSSGEVKSIGLKHHATRGDLEPLCSVGFFHVERRIDINHQVFMEREIVAVWVDSRFMERIDKDLFADLFLNFGTRKNDG